MRIGWSDGCAVTQQQLHCSIAHCERQSQLPILLCKADTQQAGVSANTPYEGWLFIQVCSAPTPMHCSIAHCKRQSSAPSAALQTGSQHALCLWSYTYGDVLFIQVCSDPAPMHAALALAKCNSHCCLLVLQNRLTACIVSVQLHLWRFALRTGVQ